MTLTRRGTKAERGAEYERGVFINCPFDFEYGNLLRPMLFTVSYLGLQPRIALERTDSGESRIEKILQLIAQSRFSIHDISRLRATEAGDVFRLNMPFELGIDFGCRRFGARQFRSKQSLVISSKPYEYQQAISDLSGFDIEAHGNEPAQIVSIVRDWLDGCCSLDAPGASRIWGHFVDFMGEHQDELRAHGHSTSDIDRVRPGQLIVPMQNWVAREFG